MKKILLIDDNQDFVELLKQRLEGNNYSVVASSNPKQIIKLAEKEEPDLIILDIVMPEMNGYQVCESLKQGAATIKIPIILITGQDLTPDSIVDRCLKLGVEAFFLKPVDSKALLAKIEELT